MKSRINWDAMGIGASLACAIHCAVLPLLITSLPVFGINIIENSGFEYAMIFVALLIGSYALWHGYRKHHSRLAPLVLFAAGMLLLFAKQRWHQYQFGILPFAVLAILLAHGLNFKLSRHGRSGSASPAPENNLQQLHSKTAVRQNTMVEAEEMRQAAIAEKA